MPRPPLPIPLRYARSRDLARREESRAWRALCWTIASMVGSAAAMFAPWPGDGFFHAAGTGRNALPCSVFFDHGEDIDKRALPTRETSSPPMPSATAVPEREALVAPLDAPLQAQELPDPVRELLHEPGNLFMADITAAVDDPFSVPSAPPRRAAPRPKQMTSPAFAAAPPAVRRASGSGRTRQIAVGENAVEEDRVRASYLDAPKPPYPVSLRMARAEGVVGVRIEVGVDGRPTQVSVARSSGYPEMDSAAERWILARWRFNPEKRAGRAVASTVTTSIHFEID